MISGFPTSIRDFLLPNKLAPLPLETFGIRYAILIGLGLILPANDWLTTLWFHWDVARLTVTTYGIEWNAALQPFSQSTFQDYVNFVINFVVRPPLEWLLLLIGMAVYGWKNLRAALAPQPGLVLRYIIIVALSLCAVSFLMEHSRLWTDPVQGWHNTPRFSDAWWLKMTALVIAPVFEEFFFRLVLFQCLRTRLTFFWAALFSGLLFGLVHSNYGLVKIPLGILVSYIFCWTWERTRSIAAPVGIHILIDVVPNF